jgi:hypothetical protein
LLAIVATQRSESSNGVPRIVSAWLIGGPGGPTAADNSAYR